MSSNPFKENRIKLSIEAIHQIKQKDKITYFILL